MNADPPTAAPTIAPMGGGDLERGSGLPVSVDDPPGSPGIVLVCDVEEPEVLREPVEFAKPVEVAIERVLVLAAESGVEVLDGLTGVEEKSTTGFGDVEEVSGVGGVEEGEGPIEVPVQS